MGCFDSSLKDSFESAAFSFKMIEVRECYLDLLGSEATSFNEWLTNAIK